MLHCTLSVNPAALELSEELLSKASLPQNCWLVKCCCSGLADLKISEAPKLLIPSSQRGYSFWDKAWGVKLIQWTAKVVLFAFVFSGIQTTSKCILLFNNKLTFLSIYIYKYRRSPVLSALNANFILSSQQLSEIDSVVMPILRTRKLRLKEMKQL